MSTDFECSGVSVHFVEGMMICIELVSGGSNGGGDTVTSVLTLSLKRLC